MTRYVIRAEQDYSTTPWVGYVRLTIDGALELAEGKYTATDMTFPEAWLVLNESIRRVPKGPYYKLTIEETTE